MIKNTINIAELFLKILNKHFKIKINKICYINNRGR